MKIQFVNIENGEDIVRFQIRYFFNIIRTWLKFKFLFPWVKYKGFVRVMPSVTFARNMDIQIGHNVQFGIYTDVASNVHFGNYILIAGNVHFVGKKDHTFDQVGKTMWQGVRGDNGTTIVEDDVWIGTNSIIMSGVRIGRGSIVAAGSVVTKDIPECEIWGGNPAKKIRDRFENEMDKVNHLEYLTR